MTRISRIYHRGPASNPATPEERNHAARSEVWHEHGVAVIDPAEVLDDWERQTVINIANAKYGRRTET